MKKKERHDAFLDPQTEMFPLKCHLLVLKLALKCVPFVKIALNFPMIDNLSMMS